MPAWVQLLQAKWPTADFRSVGAKLNTLMAVESSSEQGFPSGGGATVAAFAAGARTVRPESHSVKWNLPWSKLAGRQGRAEFLSGHGPWRKRTAFFRNRLNRIHATTTWMLRCVPEIDAFGCRVRMGTLPRRSGRTIPVSGRYTEEQREIWNIFVAAYLKVASEIKDGLTEIKHLKSGD